MSDEDKYVFEDMHKSSTVERIVVNLISLIRERQLKDGEKLPPERVLCELIGVSRPILREALKALQVMNIIDIRQGSGTYIKTLEPKKMMEHLDIVFDLDSSLYADLYDARCILESGIAKMAVNNISDAQLKAIEKNIQEAEFCIDDENQFFRKDLELHEIIMDAAGNRIIPVFMQSVNKLVLLIREKSNSVLSIRQNTLKDHKLILQALKDRDGDAAAEAMEKHIRRVETVFLSMEENKK